MSENLHDQLAERGDALFKEIAAALDALPAGPKKARLRRKFAAAHMAARFLLEEAREGGITTFSGGEPTT